MAFVETINSDTVASLPAARFAGRIVVVDRPELIGAACEDLRSHKVIGFDTETRPSFRAGCRIRCRSCSSLRPIRAICFVSRAYASITVY